MKVKFGVSSNRSKAFNAVYAFVSPAVALFWCTFHMQLTLDDSHEALMRSSTSNVPSTWLGLFCGTPYDECLCSVQSTKNISLDGCVTDHFLLGSRICPLLSFILQIWLIRELFTITGKHSRFLVKSLWICAVFTFTVIANGIYRSSCFHRGISFFIYPAGGILFLLVVHDMRNNRFIVRSSSNNHKAFNRLDVIDEEASQNEASEDADNLPISWKPYFNTITEHLSFDLVLKSVP